MKNKKKDKVSTIGSVARVTEIIASSPKSFEHAVEVGVSRACKTLDNVTGAWVQDQKVDIRNGKITAYRVNLKVTFVLKD
jgi:hypothetical protein